MNGFRSTDTGTVSVLMLALLALAGLLCLATADAAGVVIARARAQTAADAAALAAASAQWRLAREGEDPNEVARRVAESNGATLEACECALRATRAVVRVSRSTHAHMLGVAPRTVEATAVASTEPGRLFRPP
jgi:secretion/DNA translocation related TadE-like protein